MLQTAEDIKNLELDKPGRGKSLEQIKKHTVPESFSNRPIDRALQLLTKGDEVQRVSVIRSLPDLFRFDANATCTRIIPKVQQELQNSSCEFNVASCKSFKFIIEKRLPVNIIPNVLQGLEAKDPVVVNVWLEMLVDVLTSIPEDIIKKEIMPMALSKSNICQPISARIVSCAILGKLAIYPKLSQKDIKSVILPAIQGLCQDCSPDVRSAICAQIPNVCQGLGTDLNKSTIISSLVELASDNAPAVRSSAVVTIVTILPMLDQNIKKSIMLPLVMQLCEKSQTRDDVTGIVITKQFGKLVNGLISIMTQQDITWFLYCFKKLAHRGLTSKPGEIKGDPALDMVCRDNCAYNLPAIVNVMTTKAKDEMEVVYIIFRDLTADPCYIVRKSVAASIHEIIKVLGAKNKFIRADVVRLLRDDAEEVLLSLVPNLCAIFNLLSEYGILTKDKADQATIEIGRALLKCQLELTKGYNWRLLTSLLLQQEYLPNCMPADFIHQHFAPVVLSNVINGRARPVREQGAKTLLIFLKNNSKDVHQKWIRDSLITNLCYSKTSYTRIIYVKMCRHALDLFHPQYFKEHFLQPLLSLLDDPISNVRYCVVCLLPALKQALTLNDIKCKQIMADALAKLEAKETDKDVLEKYRSKAKELSDLKGVLARASALRRTSVSQITAAQGVVSQAKTGRSQQLQSTQSNVGGKLPAQKPISNERVLNKVTQRPIVRQKPGTAIASDRNFLEQHFYVDAGINIPLTHDDTNVPLLNSEISIPLVVSETEIEGLTTMEIDKLQNSTTNITDDVKVNLRKINEQSSKLQQPKSYYKIHKRHSTIISTPNFDGGLRKSLNRRSLNIQSKDLSRIPVFSSKTSKPELNKDVSNKENAKTDKSDQISDHVLENNNEIAAKNNIDSLQNSDIANENLVPIKSNNFKSKLPSNLPLATKKTTFGTA